MPIVESDPIGQRAPWPTTVLHEASSAPAKRRILETANRLFYDEGIRAVGIDRLISESEVTKATFYKHYGSKDRLIVEYVRGRDNVTRAFISDLIAVAPDPVSALRAIVDSIVLSLASPRFRGCPFINAAMEFNDSRHPVREVVREHREWYADAISALFREMGDTLPGDAGDDFVIVRDGAMTGGYAGDPVAASAALQRAADALIAKPLG